jgi:hypothetical protein
MKEDILSVQKMKHKLVTFYLFLLVVACFCQVAVKKEVGDACTKNSLYCPVAANVDDHRLPISYEFNSLTQSTNSTDSPAQQALAIGDWTLDCPHHLLMLHMHYWNRHHPSHCSLCWILHCSSSILPFFGCLWMWSLC